MLYPHRIKEEALDFEWDPFRKVILFVSDHDYADVITWYLENYPDSEVRVQADGQFEIYHPSSRAPKESVLLADLRLEDPILELDAYIGSCLIVPLSKTEGARVCGAFFIHETE
jgi:hypothetical protein